MGMNHYPLPYGAQLESSKQVQDLSQGAQEAQHLFPVAISVEVLGSEATPETSP